MLTLMEEKNFITRIPCEEDGRLKKIKVLPEGEKLKSICLAIRKEMEKELSFSLTKEEVETLKNILKKMIVHFE